MDIEVYAPVASTSTASPMPPSAVAPASLVKEAQPVRGARGPPAKSCLVCSMVADSSTSSSSKRTAKQTYSSNTSLALVPSSASSFSILAPTSLETRLADNDMSETLELELLNLYSDAGSSCFDPLYPPPVLDYIALRSRYEAVGRRLSDLSPSDQLTCRIVFASASRLSSSSAAFPSHSSRTRQLLTNAQSHADASGLWRQPSADNARALLLMHQLAGQGEISSEEARSYLPALAEQLRTLRKTDPQVVLGSSGQGATALGWCLAAFDAFAALEKGSLPSLTEPEYHRLLGNVPDELAPVEVICLAAQNDPWTLVNYCLLPLSHFISIARSWAYLFDAADGGLSAAQSVEFGELWRRAEDLMDYLVEVENAANGVSNDAFALTLLQLYLNLTYDATIFAQLAALLFLEGVATGPARCATANSLLQQHGPLFLKHACRYLRVTRASSNGNWLSVFTGSAWSVSRLATFAKLFKNTSAWDPELHTGGPADKLESLVFLHEALVLVERVYPGDEIRGMMQAVDAETSALSILLGTPSPSSLPPRHPSASPSPFFGGAPRTSPLSAAAPSLTRIAAWTHTLAKEERPATDFAGVVTPFSVGGEAAFPTPAFWTSSSFSASSPTGAGGRRLSFFERVKLSTNASRQNSPAPPTPASLPFDFGASIPRPPSLPPSLAQQGPQPRPGKVDSKHVFVNPLDKLADPEPADQLPIPPPEASSFPYLDFCIPAGAMHPPPPPPLLPDLPPPGLDPAFVESFLAQLVDEVEPVSVSPDEDKVGDARVFEVEGAEGGEMTSMPLLDGGISVEELLSGHF
ncbi:hypothetical protein JCM8097_003442 [Rhodosporidiobolus ruineniae]